MTRKSTYLALCLILAASLVLGCARAPQPSPAPAVTITVTPTVTATITPAPKPPATPTPTLTPTPTPTPSPTPTGPPKDAEIRIGIMGGQTGPAPASVVPIIKELELFFKYTNEVENGIDGVKLKWRVTDNKGTPEGGVLSYKELRDGFNPLLYIAIEDYYYLGVKDTINEDKSVLLTFSAIQPQVFVPAGRFFSLAIPTSDGFGGFVKYIMQQKPATKPKIGVLFWDLASGQQWRMAQAWAMKLGVDIEAVQFPMTTMDLKPQFMRLRDAGVTHIWMMAVAPQAAMAIRDYKSLGLTIPLYFMEYVESNPLLGLVGTGAEGFYIYRSETPFSDGTEAAKLYQKIYQWAEGKPKEADNRLTITAKAVVQAAIRRAVADVGWQKLSNEAIFNALTKLTEIDTWGNSIGFGYGPEKRIGVSTIRMAQMTKTNAISISEPLQLPRTFEGVDK